MPAQTKVIPIQVSLVMILPSAHHSPSTVNRNAKLFVIGTVSDSSECDNQLLHNLENARKAALSVDSHTILEANMRESVSVKTVDLYKFEAHRI